QTIFEVFNALLRRDASELLTRIEEVDRSGHDLANIASLLVEHARDVAVAQVLPKPAEGLPERSPDEVEQLSVQAKALGTTDLHRFFRLLVSVADDVGRSSFPRVSLEMGLLRILEVEPTPSVASLLEKLDAAIAGGLDGAVAKADAPRKPEPRTAPEPKPAPVAPSPARDDPGPGAPPVAAKPAPSPDAAPAAEPVRPSDPAPQADPSRKVPGSSKPPPEETAREPVPTAEVPAPPVESATFRNRADSAPEGTLNPEWLRFVERVEERKPGLAVFLAHARTLVFGADGAELAYDSGFYLDKAREREHKEQLNEELADYFGKAVSVTVVQATAAHLEVGTVAEHQANAVSEHDSKVKQDALEHPAVQGVVSILGGEVEEVKPLEPSDSAH
ncbi:MAG: hypothetical protein AAFX94_18410, partial [Myxococcota bacterium]